MESGGEAGVSVASGSPFLRIHVIKCRPKNPQIDPRVGVNHDRMLWAGRQTDGWRDGLTDGRTSLSYFQSDLVFFLTFLFARLVAWLLDCKEKNGLKFLFLK